MGFFDFFSKEKSTSLTAEQTRKLAERGVVRQRELAKEHIRKLVQEVQDEIEFAADKGKSFCNLTLDRCTIQQGEEVAKKLRALDFAVEVSPSTNHSGRPSLLIDWGCE